jgi:hypothetical protein
MQEFRALFRQNLDGILALDPRVCALTDDTGHSFPSNVTLTPATSLASPPSSTISLREVFPSDQAGEASIDTRGTYALRTTHVLSTKM